MRLALIFVLFTLPAFSQAPMSYNARSDQCELGTEGSTLCPSGRPLSFLNCNTGAYAAGSTWTPTNTPVAGCGIPPSVGGLTGAGNVIREPDFGSLVLRVTDSATACGNGAVFNIGDSGNSNLFASDHSKFIIGLVSGVLCLYQFTTTGGTMVATLSDITSGGSGTCTTSCTQFIAGASVIFTATDPNSLWEVNNALINKITITNPASAPSAWVFSRTKAFNFLTDCSGPCGLPSDFTPNYNGSLIGSNSDGTVVLLLSDNGQNTPKYSGAPYYSCPLPGDPVTSPGGGAYGPSFEVAYSPGKGPGGTAGWRTYSTCGFAGFGTGQAYITGNWGDSGAPTDGTCSSGTCDNTDPSHPQQPLGVSGGNPIPDRMFLHQGSTATDTYGLVSVAGSNTGPGQCSGQPCSDGPYAWEIQTTNVRINTNIAYSGHSAKGSLYIYIGGLYAAYSFHDLYYPGTELLASGGLPVDDHGSYNNDGASDLPPIFSGTTKVCDQNGTPGGSPTGSPPNGACQTYNSAAFWNEVIGITNVATQGGSSNVYRFGVNYNTGTSPYFGVQNAIASGDQSGSYALFASDWGRTLGCTNLWTGTGGQPCLDPVSANNSGTSSAISNVAVDAAGTNVTVTATNTLSAGMYTNVSGLVTATWLNISGLFIESATSSSIVLCHVTTNSVCDSAYFSAHANYNASDSTGVVNWGACLANYVHSACPRGDVFVMNLLSAGQTAGKSKGAAMFAMLRTGWVSAEQTEEDCLLGRFVTERPLCSNEICRYDRQEVGLLSLGRGRAVRLDCRAD